MLTVGSKAPDISGHLEDGSLFQLSNYLGKQNVVLYFYPGDFGRGCTKQACGFRDNYAEIRQHDAQIIGISADTEDSHKSFREEHELPFSLLADPGRKIASAYQVEKVLGLLPPRVTYVVDKEGVVRGAFRHDFAVDKHVEDVIESLKEIEKATA